MTSVNEFYSRFSQQLDRITKDTRSIQPGDIYLALKGERFDGNEFIEEALNKGALAAISDNPGLIRDERIVQVKDSFAFLKELALFHRKQLGTRIIAVTGSNGKTTTKELLLHIFKRAKNTIATSGNYNNHIGVPLTLLRLKPDHEFLILEMGANRPGDIRELCEMSEPDFGLITNIGKAHLEGFGGIEGVLKTKLELFDFLHHNQLTIFLNCDSEPLNAVSTNFSHVITYGQEIRHPDVAFRIVRLNPDIELIHVSEGEIRYHSVLYGKHNFENLMAAIAVAQFFGIAPDLIQKGIDDYIPDNMRSQQLEIRNSTVMLDAYNANPSSMHAALDVMDDITGRSKWVILGAMAELGDHSDNEHHALVDRITRGDYTRILLIGNNYKFAGGDNRVLWFESVASCRDWLDTNWPQQALILIKGSRSAGLEKLVIN
ncbi:MAG: UDP-N-acetylmuramoyl-tripeptide--D-alanyl-D-alanine ligase [Saprospiraceae bacterium]